MGKVAVIHPDLGIGGAERLIVDASKAIQESGHSVKIYTFYHDKNRCFNETRDGTLDVYVVGGWIPRTVFGKCHALMAYLKIIYIAIYLLLFSNHDFVLCDQISAGIPILRLRKNKIVFYCHFPDQLLTDRKTFLKSSYRKVIDWFEEWSTLMADVILVNSQFTYGVARQTFKKLRSYDDRVAVVNPCVDLNYFQNAKPSLNECSEQIKKLKGISKDNFVYLSLNRFERKKNIELAIEGLDFCSKKIKHAGQLMKAHLIIAGGYDARLQDSRQYYNDLKRLVAELGLESNVTFVESPSENEKLLLLQICNVMVYTPENEHFGIVPLEAMASSRAVIVCNSGGPADTIEESGDQPTGFLCDPTKTSFGKSMLKVYNDPELCKKIGSFGPIRVSRRYSYKIFAEQLIRQCNFQTKVLKR